MRGPVSLSPEQFTHGRWIGRIGLETGHERGWSGREERLGEGVLVKETPHLEPPTTRSNHWIDAGEGSRLQFFYHVPMRSTNPVTSLMLSELLLPQSGPAQEWR